ncbi:MAG: hypothetical protein KJP00_15495, partial [Bacteroidia bacterium]|nr:hypothetical protein [Bacteroidia bacterium]
MSSGVRFIYCIIISLLTGTSLCAQKYYLSHYGVTEGLASSEVNCAFQDSLGQMWIGTNDGLYLFNGISFKPIKRDIPSQYIRDMVPMKDHSLVFSHDAGLTFARPLLDSILIPDQPLSTSVKYPNRLFSDTQDRLWISQPNGELIRFDGSETTTILSEEIDKQDVMIHYSFAAVNESDFIIASPNGNIYYHKDNSSELITLGKVFDIEDILYVDNKLYIAGEGLAVAEFTDAKNSLSITWESANFNSIFTALACDKLDRIFVGTDDSGLYQLTRRQGAFQLAEVFSNNDPHRVDRLPFKHINALNITSDNSIWVCSNKGLGLLQRRFFEGTQNLPNDNATTQALDDNGDIYVSMGDVYKIQKIDQEFSATKLDVPSIGAFNGLAVDRNDLWAGTNDGQVIKMDLNGQLKKVLSFSSRGAGVFRICADSENRKWFCQAPRGQPIFGLAMIDKNDQIHMYGKDKGFDNRMLVVKESPRKELYAAGIGTASYLYRYSPDQDEFINMSIPFSFPVSPNFEVHDIAIDNQGLVWLATTDGLLRHDMENIIRPDLGSYTGNEVRAVAVLPDTSIWISTDIYGMLRYKDGEILSFGEDAGLPTKIMAYRSIIADQDAKLWVNTLEGVAHTSQDLPHPFPTSTPILKSLSYNDKNLDLQRSS